MAVRFRIGVVGQEEPLLDVSERFLDFLLDLLWEYPGDSFDAAIKEMEPFRTINVDEVYPWVYPEWTTPPIQYSPRDFEIALERILELTRESLFGNKEYKEWTGGPKQDFVELMFQVLAEVRALPRSAMLEPHKYD